MAWRNPYSAAFRQVGDGAPLDRQALLDALNEPEAPPPPPLRDRTRPPAGAPVDYAGPSGPQPDRRGFNDPQRTADLTRNAYTGPVDEPTRTAPPNRGRDLLSQPGGRTQALNIDTDDDRGIGDLPEAQPPVTGATPRDASARPDGGHGLDILDQYDDDFERRNEGSPSVIGSASTGAQIGGYIVPGAGHVVGGLVGAAAALFAKNAPTAISDLRAGDAQGALTRAYRDMFGRDPAPGEVETAMRGQGWTPEDGDRWLGEASAAYILDQWAQHAAAEMEAADAAPAAENGAAPAAVAPGPGPGQSRYAVEGFDLTREQDPGFSAKDAFLAGVQQAGTPPPGEDKAALGEWFTANVQPFMEAQGHTINWVDGDKVNITSPQGTGTIDWYRGAGAPGGALAWQAEGAGGGGGVSGSSGATSIQDAYAWLKANADPSWSRSEMEAAVTAAFGDVPGFEKAYAGDVVINGRKIDLITDFEGANPSWSDNLSFVPLHGGGSGARASGGLGSTGGGLGGLLAPGVSLAAPLGQSDVNAAIMAELQRIINGAPSRDALLEALGVGQ
jgi:hypothetical protein